LAVAAEATDRVECLNPTAPIGAAVASVPSDFQTAKLRRGCPDVGRDSSSAAMILDYYDFTKGSALRSDRLIIAAGRASDRKLSRVEKGFSNSRRRELWKSRCLTGYLS